MLVLYLLSKYNTGGENYFLRLNINYFLGKTGNNYEKEQNNEVCKSPINLVYMYS